MWMFPTMGVPPNTKTFILMESSIINNPFLGTPILEETPCIYIYIYE